MDYLHRSSVKPDRGVDDYSRPPHFGPLSAGRADACLKTRAVATYELILPASDSRARMGMKQVMSVR